MKSIGEYIAEHSTQETEALAWIEKQTHIRTNHARMLTGAVQGRFLKMLVEATSPQNILEIGTFTGYSAVCLAMSLPVNGHLDTLEINDELESLILEGFERAGLAEKISLIIGDAKKSLERLREEILEKNTRPQYDLVYIDANKREYPEYYDLVFDIVKTGGYILADNVLWDGKVCQEPLPRDKQTAGIAAFNDMIARDPRVESVIMPVRDGLNFIRKLTGSSSSAQASSGRR